MQLIDLMHAILLSVRDVNKETVFVLEAIDDGAGRYCNVSVMIST
jgi:hypothetical protein